MVPKEKAEELLGKMCGNDCSDTNIKKMINSALIAVNEIIEAFDLYGNDLMGEINYWQEVKSELEKLK